MRQAQGWKFNNGMIRMATAVSFRDDAGQPMFRYGFADSAGRDIPKSIFRTSLPFMTTLYKSITYNKTPHGNTCALPYVNLSVSFV